jgi:hypothetical protein
MMRGHAGWPPRLAPGHSRGSLVLLAVEDSGDDARMSGRHRDPERYMPRHVPDQVNSAAEG